LRRNETLKKPGKTKERVCFLSLYLDLHKYEIQCAECALYRKSLGKGDNSSGFFGGCIEQVGNDVGANDRSQGHLVVEERADEEPEEFVDDAEELVRGRSFGPRDLDVTHSVLFIILILAFGDFPIARKLVLGDVCRGVLGGGFRDLEELTIVDQFLDSLIDKRRVEQIIEVCDDGEGKEVHDDVEDVATALDDDEVDELDQEDHAHLEVSSGESDVPVVELVGVVERVLHELHALVELALERHVKHDRAHESGDHEGFIFGHRANFLVEVTRRVEAVDEDQNNEHNLANPEKNHAAQELLSLLRNDTAFSKCGADINRFGIFLHLVLDRHSLFRFTFLVSLQGLLQLMPTGV